MNILFLDYDGVVNTPMWQLSSKGEMRCLFNFPDDNKVNNFQACQWVSEFCEKYNYEIIVTSTWRLHDNYKECLVNGGLRPDVVIRGRTKDIWNKSREEEIRDFLLRNHNIDNYIILDDEEIEGFEDHFVMCPSNTGFQLTEFAKAEKLHETQNSLRKAERTK